MTLNNFVQQWNSDTLSGFNVNIADPEQSLFSGSQIVHQLRPSSLGQMAFITAMEYIICSCVPKDSRTRITQPRYGRLTDLLNVGTITEERIASIMRHNGYDIKTQVPCTFNSGSIGEVKGTADIVLADTVVIDVKTASASNVKRLVASGGGQKYITQLAIYAEALQLKYASLLVYNKDNSELTLIDVPRKDLRNAVERVEAILEQCTVFAECPTLEGKVNELYVWCEEPKPVPQVYKKEPTGRYLIPQELLYQQWLVDILYDTESGVNDSGAPTRYIVRVLPIAEVVERLAVYIDTLIGM